MFKNHFVSHFSSKGLRSMFLLFWLFNPSGPSSINLLQAVGHGGLRHKQGVGALTQRDWPDAWRPGWGCVEGALTAAACQQATSMRRPPVVFNSIVSRLLTH